MKFMEQFNKGMKISKEELLENETWIDPFSHIIITSDVTWEDGAGEVCHGFNMKAMTESEFKEAIDSGDAGNYILERYPADGTGADERLTRLSVDEALCLVNDSTSRFFLPDRRRFCIEVCPKIAVPDQDHEYVIQTKWFDSKRQAIAWYKANFDYVDAKCCAIRLVIAQYFNVNDYDIVATEELAGI